MASRATTTIFAALGILILCGCNGTHRQTGTTSCNGGSSLSKEDVATTVSLAEGVGYSLNFDAALLQDRSGVDLLGNVVEVDGYLSAILSPDEKWFEPTPADDVASFRSVPLFQWQDTGSNVPDDVRDLVEEIRDALLRGIPLGAPVSNESALDGASLGDAFALFSIHFALNDADFGPRAKVSVAVVRQHRFSDDQETKAGLALLIFCDSSSQMMLKLPSREGLKCLKAYLKLAMAIAHESSK
jgi:hypothetical protein